MRTRILSTHSALEHFQIRGGNGSRLEGFSDGIFSLAVAILLLTTNVPKNFVELWAFVKDVVPFFLCIGFIYLIWIQHVVFFARYGLQDEKTNQMNMMLLFCVLFYVYPLKFLLTIATKSMVVLVLFLLGDTASSAEQSALNTMIGMDKIPMLMAIYGAGFGAVFFLFYRLYRHAQELGDVLALTPMEYWETVFSARFTRAMALTAFISVAIALLGIAFRFPMASFFSGMAYNYLWVYKASHTKAWKKKMEELAIPATYT
ncbi:MAG: hypothetical protein KIPDCIKN_03153 [Haliscomenobacter sp.]|nr:hypothetical protein [Haliscomenobacter sp.]